MTQRDRDRLVALKKANKKLITQRQAAAEIGIGERQVRRLVARMKSEGDGVVIHGLRGKRSNRRIDGELERQIITMLSEPVYRGFGPTLASEYLREEHGIAIGREALRQRMAAAGLWRARPRKAEKVHLWRERKARFGELVQWDTSDHDWLEGRGNERIYLIHMIDDATSRLMARFVRHDATEQNMGLLRSWLERYGRPLAFYTDKDSMFHNAPKRTDGEAVKQMPPTQIGRALEELQIAALKAHSPQAKGRVERSFQTAQDRLVKGMRVAGVGTLEGANQYLESQFLPWWEAHCTVVAAHPDDAHRPLGREHDLDAVLSHVEPRKVYNDHTFRADGRQQIDPRDIVPGLRGGWIRVEWRSDGTRAASFQGRALRFTACPGSRTAQPADAGVPPRAKRPKQRGHNWMQNFDLQQQPAWRDIYRSGALNRP